MFMLTCLCTDVTGDSGYVDKCLCTDVTGDSGYVDMSVH